jgi:hypothetical protein
MLFFRYLIAKVVKESGMAMVKNITETKRLSCLMKSADV